MLVGVKKLEREIIDEIKEIRAGFPELGIVLLFLFYNPEGIQFLRNLAITAKAGMAVFLKQSLDRMEQLVTLTMAVSEGQVILDPALTSLQLTESQRSL